MTRPVRAAAATRPHRTALAIRQIGFQGLGVLRAPLEAAGYEVEYHDAFAEDPRRINATAPDILVVLGGPYGVDEGPTRPFIDAQIELLRTRLGAQRPTFGICLGAQLVAKALGATVKATGTKEIGWAPVQLTDEGASGPLAELADLPLLHWHGDTFDLPDGAVRLAGTEVCRNQAFAIGHEIMAAQFHLEVDPRCGIGEWIACHLDELRREGIDADRLEAEARAAATTDRDKVRTMFARWLAGLD